jgi:hypothetical protein
VFLLIDYFIPCAVSTGESPARNFRDTISKNRQEKCHGPGF